jgi:L-ascorbate metabolism protein UlaG (beta-lactamase superfamily)
LRHERALGASLGVGKWLKGFGVADTAITELDWTESVTVRSNGGSAGLHLTALPARHFSGRGVRDRFETLWSSFVLKGERHNIYYGADSGMWDGFSEIGTEYGPFDLTMLEVGAYHELWKAIHLGPDAAAQAFAAMGNTGLLMPVHWGLFQLALHSWRQPMERIAELAEEMGIRLWAPEPGKPTEIVVGREHRSEWWRK